MSPTASNLAIRALLGRNSDSNGGGRRSTTRQKKYRGLGLLSVVVPAGHITVCVFEPFRMLIYILIIINY